MPRLKAMHFTKPNSKIKWSYKTENNNGRIIYRWVIAEDYPDDDAVNLFAFMGYMGVIWNAIPVELQHHAVIRLARDDYECGKYPEFEVYIDREETDEEYAARQKKEKEESRKYEEADEKRQRTLYETLKKKYDAKT